MVGKFSIGDKVIYENRVYKVSKIYTGSWDSLIRFVYGLLPLSDNRDPSEMRLISVREDLLCLASEDEIKTRRVLYD